MTARALGAIVRSALAEAWSNRSGFWTQVMAMAVNDLAWVIFWVLFFRRVGSVRGWDTSRVLVLQAILTTGGGLVLGFFGNARRIGRLAVEGGIDAALALPVPTLPYLLVRRIDTINLGDLLFGVTLFAVAGHPTPARTAVYLVLSVCAAVLLTGFLVATGSLAFFAGRNEAGELGFHAMLMFSAYPTDVFAGAAKLVLYTAIPAAFVATVPARLVDDFDPWVALGMVTASLTFAVAGWTLFTLGLRRYTSGGVWTRA